MPGFRGAGCREDEPTRRRCADCSREQALRRDDHSAVCTTDYDDCHSHSHCSLQSTPELDRKLLPVTQKGALDAKFVDQTYTVLNNADKRMTPVRYGIESTRAPPTVCKTRKEMEMPTLTQLSAVRRAVESANRRAT